MAGTKINYTGYDFDTIKQELITKLSQEDVFKDYNFAGSNINTLLELVASVGDIFGYYLNMVANESFISSADLYENLNKLSELVGYNPKGYVSATTTLTASTVPALYDLTTRNNYKLVIPKYSKFVSSEKTIDGQNIYYTNPNDAILVIDTNVITLPLSANAVTFDIPVVQGIPTDEGNELLYYSDGSKYQKFVLFDDTATIQNILVTVAGEEWTNVSNMYRSIDSSSKVYTIRFNKDKKLEIKFGDGIYGVIPPIASEIKVKYIASLGFKGNINNGLITKLEGDIYETSNTGVTTILDSSKYVLTQSTAGTGGSDPEDEDAIRNNAPSTFRSQQRAVTKQDYEDVISANFGKYISKIKALNYFDVFGTTNTGKLSDRLSVALQSSLTDVLLSGGFTSLEAENLINSPQQLSQTIYYNNIYLVLVPVYGVSLTKQIKEELNTLLDDYRMVTTNHVYLDPTFVKIDINIYYSKKSTSVLSDSEIQMIIRNAITTYFNKDNRSIGEKLIHIDIVDACKTNDISSLIVEAKRQGSTDNTNRDIQLVGIEFPELGNLNIGIL